MAAGLIKPDRELLSLVEEYAKRQRNNKIYTIFPDTGPLRRELYPKHLEFMAAGKDYKERAALAANRSGKSFMASYEVGTHVLLEYPAWWTGRVFNKSINVWAIGTSAETTRDICQKLLVGPSNELGTGMIPKDRIVETFTNRDVSNSLSEVWIRNNLGEISKIVFKSYNQGETSFQGTEQDVIWLDEEPPMDIYSECLIRTMTVDGIIICTFTPKKGFSEVVLSYLPDGEIITGHPTKFAVNISWNEVPHLTEKQKQEILAGTPPYLREAVSKGVPQLGIGAIYPIPEDLITCEPFEIPSHWPRAYGLDVGWRKTAAIWGAYNPDADTWYLYDEYYRGEVESALHAAAIKARGNWICGVVDPAAGASNIKDGQALINVYENLELFLSPANNSVEAGIDVVFVRLNSGRLKIFKTCYNWFSEYRMYRRKEDKNKGVKVVKYNDHLMDASRYLMMSGLEVATTRNKSAYFNRMHPGTYDNMEDTSTTTGMNPVTGY